MTAPALINAQNVSALKGERLLYKAVDLQVSEGAFVVLRGKNGAGKTTLLRQLAGLSESETGSIVRAKAHHWLGHSNGLKSHETPRTHLRHWAKVWGSRADIDIILSQMGLSRPANVPCRLLSAGQKRRTALGRLLLTKRTLWLLDEPFTALDQDGQTLLAGMIEAHRAEGGAVITALHGDSPITPSAEIML